MSASKPTSDTYTAYPAEADSGKDITPGALGVGVQLDRIPRCRPAPDDVRHDNTVRAKWASTAVAGYVAVVHDDADMPAATVLQDLLCDVRHLCDALGVNYDEAADVAANRYNDEIRGRI